MKPNLCCRGAEVERDGLARMVDELLEQGQPEAAVRLFTETQGRGIAADWPTSDRVATTLLHLGRPAEASQVWEHAAAPLSPSQRHVRIATALLAALDFPAAERGYRAALELDPTLGEAWFGLAWLHTQRGDSAQALAACQQGLQQVLTPARLRSWRALRPLSNHPSLTDRQISKSESQARDAANQPQHSTMHLAGASGWCGRCAVGSCYPSIKD